MQSYQSGRFKINGKSYTQPLALSHQQILDFKLPNNANELTIENLQQIGFKGYEVVILGTGGTLTFPDWDLLEQAQCLGRSLEIMATDAACRTFTALADEGRKVLAILYP
ncbi:MAG: hypothetical protein HWE16_12940 [Gammaproteobacteria bacterium]|nr:hypothetical protein [Gammaproteobacteria bacterium]